MRLNPLRGVPGAPSSPELRLPTLPGSLVWGSRARAAPDGERTQDRGPARPAPPFAWDSEQSPSRRPRSYLLLGGGAALGQIRTGYLGTALGLAAFRPPVVSTALRVHCLGGDSHPYPLLGGPPAVPCPPHPPQRPPCRAMHQRAEGSDGGDLSPVALASANNPTSPPLAAGRSLWPWACLCLRVPSHCSLGYRSGRGDLFHGPSSPRDVT